MKKPVFILICFLVLFFAFAGCKSTQSSSVILQSQGLVGAFSDDRDTTEDYIQLFNQAIPTEGGKTYTLLKVSSQVVAGTNYRFTVTVDAGGNKYDAHVYIFKPLNGAPEFVREEKI